MSRLSPGDVAAQFVRDFRLEDYAFYLMGHVDHLYGQGLEQVLGSNKVSRAEWRSLAALAQYGRLSIGELADITLMKRPTLSRVAERLEIDGLVDRRVRPEDQRITDVTITDDGRQVFRNVLRVTGVQYARAIQGLEDSEISDLNRILRKMVRNLSESPLTLLAGQVLDDEEGKTR